MKFLFENREAALFLSRLRGKGSGASLARGAMFVFLINSVSIACIFILHLVIARLMGADHYGVFSYVMAWVYFFTIFGKTGWDSTLVRYVSSYNSTKNWGLLAGLLKTTKRASLISSIFISTTALCVLLAIRQKLSSDLFNSFMVGCIAVPFLVMTLLNAAVLRGLHCVILSPIPDAIMRPLATLILALVWYAMRSHLSSVDTVTASLISAVIASFASYYWVVKKLPAPPPSSAVETRSLEWIKVSLSFFLISSVSLIMNRIDILMIGFMRGTREAGIYAVASRSAGLVSFGLGALNFVIAPMIAGLYAQGQMKELQRVLTLGSRGILLFSIPFFLGMVFFGKQVLGLFGHDFAAGYRPLVILALGQFINALAGPVDYLMTMTKHQKEAGVILSICCLINVILNYVLIPVLGNEGSAIATMTSLILWNLIFSWRVWFHLRLRVMPV